MNIISELMKLANEMKAKFPEKEEQINELLEDCFYEIDFGGAELYEVEYCYDSIKKLIK